MVSNDLKEQVDYYSSLPYTLVIEGRDEHSDYCVASFAELPDLFMVGSTPEESIAELESVKKDWIETYLELGNKMPVPLKLRKFSGNYSLRMQRSLHKALALHAALEGVSINQYVVSALSRTVGREGINQEKVC
jgi:predicted HicB family RNase H-like nuclease